MQQPIKKGLYAITPNEADAGRLLANVESALQAGIALLQYRDKTSTTTEKLRRANALHELCIQYATPLIINDNPELAYQCNAEGVHLGQGDTTIDIAREMLGKEAIIGITCHHDLQLALKAQKQGANYVAFGRFFNSSTKPGAPLADIHLVRQASTQLNIPITAIGGLTLDNSKPIIKAGAHNIAVVEGVFSKTNIKDACLGFNQLFYSAG